MAARCPLDRSDVAMIPNRDAEYLAGLVANLRQLPRETEWVEFKVDQATEPQRIGEYISALANGAALNGKESAYLLWGIDDGSHAVDGTCFVPAAAKYGNEPLENWLRRGLTPRVDFRFHEVAFDGKRVVVLEIEPARQQPVAFNRERYVRVGSVKKNLREHPEKERALWQTLDSVAFEEGIARERLNDDNVLELLDYATYFRLLERPIPENIGVILYELKQDRLIATSDAGGWNITNLGAVMLAHRIGDFRLERKAVRVIHYRGAGRTEAISERASTMGYGVGFVNLIKYITDKVSTEVIGQGLRRTTTMVPELAVRELVANALVHQDFSVTGAGPTVEIFDARIEITNPGAPLVDTQRFLGSPPISRNDAMASLMRRLGICEERGSGIEKVVSAVEAALLPAPLFEAFDKFTRATLFAHKDLSDMDRAERVRACYLHACLRYRLRLPMNNTSLRERFNLAGEQTDRVSRVLREAVDEGLIAVRDPDAGNRHRAYLPFWAA